MGGGRKGGRDEGKDRTVNLVTITFHRFSAKWYRVSFSVISIYNNIKVDEDKEHQWLFFCCNITIRQRKGFWLCWPLRNCKCCIRIQYRHNKITTGFIIICLVYLFVCSLFGWFCFSIAYTVKIRWMNL